MKKGNDNKLLLIVLLGTVILFIAGRLLGASLFSNGWSFAHWEYMPFWYIISWFVFLCALAFILSKYIEAIADFFDSIVRIIAGVVILMFFFWFFQFDSFLYGGGNLRIAQIAQTRDIILRWYEYGTVLVVYYLKSFYDLFGLHYNTAGVYAWKTLSFLCAILSIIGTLKITCELTKNKIQRLAIFFVLLAGPSLLMLFGFIGIEPVIVTVTIWFAYAMLTLYREFNYYRLLFLWGLLFIGMFFHATVIYLLPAAVFITLTTLPVFQKRKILWGAFIFALLVWAGLIAGVYIRSQSNLELAKYILFISGKNPQSDYGLFSLRHIGDMIQVAFLVFPVIILSKFLVAQRIRTFFTQPLFLAGFLMWGGGFCVMFIADPVHSIVFDLPRFSAYLTSGAILLAVIISISFSGDKAKTPLKFFGLLTAVVVALPLSYLPVYLSIHKAEGYVESYLDRHDSYWVQGAPAMRDAFFYRKEFDKANHWDRAYIVKSADYLNYKGILELAGGGEEGAALKSLTPLIIRNPYWADLRTTYARIMMNLKRYDLAKPQLDTALMLEPYNKQNLIALYSYYRDTKSITQAFKAVKRAAKIYPSDLEIRTDLMIINYSIGMYKAADSLADNLMTTDPNLPYPYLIKGFSLEKQGMAQSAVSHYNKFLQLAQGDSDTLIARERRDHLLELMKDKK